MAGVGDLDGNGCDEFAVGADSDQLGREDQGSVRVFFGYGPRCGGIDTPQVVTLVSGGDGNRLGSSVAGGVDADGDGVPDLAMGGLGTNDAGAVWFASGAWVAAQPRDDAVVLPVGDTQRVLLDPVTRFVGGAGAGVGQSVALLTQPHGPAWVAVGEPGGALGGTSGAGGVRLLRYTTGVPEVAGWIAGLSTEPNTGFGEALFADPRLPVLLVGAPLTDVGALDAGAVYPFRVR